MYLGCWDPLMEIHSWSNVVCVRQGDAWAAVLETFRVTPEVAKNELIKANALDKTFSLPKRPTEKCEL